MTNENQLVKRIHKSLDKIIEIHNDEVRVDAKANIRRGIGRYIDQQTTNDEYRMGFREYVRSRFTMDRTPQTT